MKIKRIIEIDANGLGDRIKQARGDRTITEVSNAAGLSRKCWREIETESVPAVMEATLQKIEAVLGKSFSSSPAGFPESRYTIGDRICVKTAGEKFTGIVHGMSYHPEDMENPGWWYQVRWTGFVGLEVISEENLIRKMRGK